MKAWIAERPAVSFYLLTLALSWGYWVTLLAQGRRVVPCSVVTHVPGLGPGWFSKLMLVLVHRQQLLEQWIERLSAFLGLPAKAIGRIGGGWRRPSGQIDVAVIQSLVSKGVVNDCVAGYGQLIEGAGGGPAVRASGSSTAHRLPVARRR